MPRHLLVLDAYAPEGREALRSAGGTPAGQLYRDLLRRLEPDVEVDIAFPADPDPGLPGGIALADYDGAVWTGSSLTILKEADPRVGRQIELARALAGAAVPCFGSCWAAQLAAVVSGGWCAANPRGREFGISRRIELSRDGRAHPFYRDKPSTFDAFTSHADEVVELGEGGLLLASNAWSHVQGVAIERGQLRFWAVQYHPEYDLHEVASLCRLRLDELVSQGTFATIDVGRRFIDDLETLHRDPTRTDLAAAHQIGAELMDEDVRTREVRNWLDTLGR